MRQHLVGVARQGEQQPVFRRGQAHLGAVKRHPAGGAVDEQAALIEDEGSGVAAASGMALRHADARDQLRGGERLGQVIVGPQFERGDLVALAVARRQDHDRRRAPVANAADDVHAVHVGQAQIEQDHVRAPA